MKIAYISAPIIKYTKDFLPKHTSPIKKYVPKNDAYLRLSPAPIPYELRVSFSKLQKTNGKRFVKKAYKELVKFFGLEEIAPKKIKFKKLGYTQRATCDKLTGQIAISNKVAQLDTKDKQLGTIAHELKHFEQFSRVIRTENVGVEGYTDALADNGLLKRKYNFFDMRFWDGLVKARKEGTADEYMASVKQAIYAELLPIVKRGFSRVISQPQIPDNVHNRQAAEKYLRAIRNYLSTDDMGGTWEKYRNNLLEVEAYRAGHRMQNYYKTFEKSLTEVNKN